MKIILEPKHIDELKFIDGLINQKRNDLVLSMAGKNQWFREICLEYKIDETNAKLVGDEIEYECDSKEV